MSRMENLSRALFGLAVTALVAGIAAAPASATSDLDVYWKDGLNFKNEEAGVSMKIGGRIQNDWGWFAKGDDYVPVVDGTEFRRARIYLQGDLGQNLFFKSQFDFSNRDQAGSISDELSFKDMYMGLKGIPVVGRLLVGQMKEPFSLEEMTSSNYITFMERSAVAVFDSERNTGFMLQNNWMEKRLLASFGVFRESDAKGGSRSNNAYNWSGRVTGLPWMDSERKRLLHVGVSGSLRRTLDGEQSYGSRPSSHLAPRLVSTDDIPADKLTLGALEAALVLGPLSVDAEYKTSLAKSEAYDDPRMSGYYVQASYFLTGESRPYKSGSGAFDRVRPQRPLGVGPGAWELAARYSFVDLTEGNGGKMDDFVFGVNWYANNNARVMLNYVYAKAKETADGEAKFSGFQTRFAVYF